MEAYASSSDDAESDGKPTAPTVSMLGELPADVLGMFKDSGEILVVNYVHVGRSRPSS